ncbi:MAG: hypothetical protein ACI81R_002576 [Bradymonadia bacterium]|jgi:hypothetical protein
MDAGTVMLVQFGLGLFGSAYLLYGWRGKKIAATIAGLLVCILPMVVGHLGVLVVLSLLLLAIPWFVRV